MLLTGGHLNETEEYMITGVIFYIVFIKSTGIWTLTSVVTKFEN